MKRSAKFLISLLFSSCLWSRGFAGTVADALQKTILHFEELNWSYQILEKNYKEQTMNLQNIEADLEKLQTDYENVTKSLAQTTTDLQNISKTLKSSQIKLVIWRTSSIVLGTTVVILVPVLVYYINKENR